MKTSVMKCKVCGFHLIVIRVYKSFGNEGAVVEITRECTGCKRIFRELVFMNRRILC
jgi:hypothetical protein